MNVTQYLEAMALSVLGLMDAPSPEFKEKELLVNDMNNVMRQRIVEYVTWVSGDSDALFNLYNVNNMIEFPTEPYYWKNRRSFYWARSATDDDVKRTHCGFARDMIDTSVLVCGDPVITVKEGQSIGGVDAGQCLDNILEANDFYSIRRKKQMPMTLTEGWGAWKITWNVKAYGKEPVLSYYRAENVRVWRRMNRLLGITFLDWYTDGKGHKYLVAETRVNDPKGCYFRTDYFMGDESSLQVIDRDDCPFKCEGDAWKDMPCLFAEPCSYYEDPLHGYEGRSVLEGRLDLLDDLDQAFSQAANTVRRSTPIETFDLDFCERDPKTLEPKLPKTFERKYIQIRGKANSYGEKEVSKPVDVTQPSLNTQLYDEHILTLERTIVNGHLSPATLGLDIDKKDHSKDDSKRDISVTLFTRNHLTKEDGKTIKSLMRQLLVAKEFLATGKVTKRPCDWDVEVAFDEFSDQSFESKLEALSSVLVNDGISPEMYVDKVYGNSISEEDRQKEIDWITENHKNRTQSDQMEANPMEGMEGMPEGMDVPPEEE